MSSAKKITIIILCLLCFQTARAEWIKRESGTLAWLRDIYFLNENKGFIAGSGGTFLSTKDGGKTWKTEAKFTSDNIEQIYFSDENTGWLLCQRNQFSRGANSSSYLLKTVDGGASWEQVNFDAGRARITKIFFAKTGFAMAIGEAGFLIALQDDGKKWKRVVSPTKHLLLDGRFIDDFHGTIVGAGGSVLFTEDAGASWNSAVIQGAAKPKLNKVFFVNQKSGWTIGNEGKIYQTINGGKAWREQKSGTTQNLTDIFFLNTAEGWAVGEGGTILHSTTAGNIWTRVESKVNHKLEKVFFNGKKGWAVGFGGTILTFDNAKMNNNSIQKPQLQKRSE
jgi:photosystem II stability/assembly factor-like uncharacterized protein